MDYKLFTIFIVISTVISQGSAVQVTVEQGTVRGSTHLSRNGSEYYAFLSIPFAKPPVGELRFELAQPPDPWEGIKDVTQRPPACTQIDIFCVYTRNRISGQEDCLYLSVYTPAKKTQPLPVMVFIHGGAWIAESGTSYQPKYLMDEKIIVVAIQYRLNILGFLSTGDHVLPGNLGMKDQVAALKWVQKNIADFGGDPEKVTIFGDSAGGASVHYHLHSPLSQGLFHRAISQSGTVLAPWAYTARTVARQRAMALGVLTACPTKNSQALINCLKKLPAEELVSAHNKFYISDFHPPIPFAVVSEPDDIEGAFITENPWHLEVVSNVPWMTGFTSGQGGILAARYLQNNATLAAELNKHFKRFFSIGQSISFWMEDETRINEVTELVKKFYFGDKDIGLETAHELVRFGTDSFFAYNALEAAQRHKNTVYFYYYDHRNENTFNQFYGRYDGELGVTHLDDCISLFAFSDYLPEVTEGNDLEVSKRLIKYWVNFAYSGNPNSNYEHWKPMTSNNMEYLHITTKADEMKNDLIKERYEFWKSLQLIPSYEVKNTPKFTDEL